MLGLVLSGGQEVAVSGPEVVYRYTATAASVPSYVFRMRVDGSGSFVETVAGADGAPFESKGELKVSAKTAEAVFAQAEAVKGGGFHCASKAKGIANTGAKVLEFGGGSCTWNFSENKNVTGMAEVFQGMAFTLDEGRKLAFKRRYDRLGLNDEMTFLWDGVKSGQALELGNIAGVLGAIAGDGEVMERVRVKAAELAKMK